MPPIKDRVRVTLKLHTDEVLSRQEIIDLVVHSYPGTNRSGVIPSDYCYNLYNRGITFDFHILEWVERKTYKVLGQGYRYNGPILWKGRQIGEWSNGVKTIYKDI
ncbi:MAG: hypothetical protein D4R93_06015 [Deltaproteobacteria bacterium]|nr:MAG: hypothetical protein D4R93_06015 [Deltaproteobacteria bacterium]